MCSLLSSLPEGMQGGYLMFTLDLAQQCSQSLSGAVQKEQLQQSL